jgi:hemerythrin superfamily protein
MDPITKLKTDHRNVELLFEQFESSESRGARVRQEIVRKVVAELSLHTAIEERIVYPFVRKNVPELDEKILESLEEHRVVKKTLVDLRQVRAGDERLDARMRVLAENVMRHAEEEEDVVLPRLSASCSEEELMELGERMEAMRRSRRPSRRGKTRIAAARAERERERRRAA